MPTRFRTQKHAPFVDLPRHKRRNAVVRLGWKIAQQADGRGFWTDHLMEDPEDPHRTHSWVDVYFLGADRFTLWNAEFVTKRLAVEDEIRERSFSAAYAQLSAEEIESEFAMAWQTIPRKHPGAMRMREWVQRPDRYYPQFEGRTFSQECDRLEAHYLATDPPAMTERFTIDRSYAHGIGLHAMVDETNLNIAAIERTIQRFRDMGEQNWSAYNC